MARNKSVARVVKRLQNIPRMVREELIKENLATAEEVANVMRRFAPVDSGALKESITVTPGGEMTPLHSQPGGRYVVPDNQVVITAGDNAARYAHLVEWGTNDTEAKPFFWPVIRSMRQRMLRKLRAAARKAVKRGVK